MTTTITLSDGTKLRTSSTRRYVTFTISDDSQVAVYQRTDDLTKGHDNHRMARRRYLRAVTVDTTTKEVIADD